MLGAATEHLRHGGKIDDAGHDSQITVDELLTAVNDALNGCLPQQAEKPRALSCHDRGPRVSRCRHTNHVNVVYRLDWLIRSDKQAKHAWRFPLADSVRAW